MCHKTSTEMHIGHVLSQLSAASSSSSSSIDQSAGRSPREKVDGKEEQGMSRVETIAARSFQGSEQAGEAMHMEQQSCSDREACCPSSRSSSRQSISGPLPWSRIFSSCGWMDGRFRPRPRPRPRPALSSFDQPPDYCTYRHRRCAHLALQAK